MEYSKEDLMEAKKQIWGVGENMGTEESKTIRRKRPPLQILSSGQRRGKRFPLPTLQKR